MIGADFFADRIDPPPLPLDIAISTSLPVAERPAGHLFANRYKAVLCEEDAYLLQLIRYVHLNPVRAKLVRDASDYPWSSHPQYLQRTRALRWLDTETALEMLGGRAAYRRFIADGVTEGERRDLCGIGNRGGDNAGEGNAADARHLWLGGLVLGTERFARRVLKTSRQQELEREMRRDAATDLPSLTAAVARELGVRPDRLLGHHRDRTASAGRRELVRRAVVEGNVQPAAVARHLGIRTPRVTGHVRVLRCEGRESTN